MNKLLLFFTGFVILLFTSCNDDFSTKTTVEDKYILYCTVQSNAADPYNFCSVTATVSHVYDVEGYDPSTNTVDPNITDAKIYLNIKGANYELAGGYIKNSAGDKEYVYKAVVKATAGDTAIISASLPNKKVLSSASRIPLDLNITLSYPFEGGFTTKLDRFLWGKSFDVSWKSRVVGHLFFPKASVNYTKTVNGATQYYTVDIPSSYIKVNGVYEAVYPTYQLETSCSFDYSAIDSVMAKIASDDKEKQNKFSGITLKILEFDSPLSNYYSSIHGYLDHFSVRLDDDVFTNITGGIGVFGTNRVTSMNFEFRDDYLAVFGY